MVGKEVEFEGLPIGSKANHAIKTDCGCIPIDRSWPDNVHSNLTGAKHRVVVRGLLVYVPERIYHAPPALIQTIYQDGERIPAHYYLRNVEVIKVR
jgi:hypothetical protein